MPARKPSQPETTAMVDTTARPNRISDAVLRARLRADCTNEEPESMVPPRLGRVFGTSNIAISFPAARGEAGARERGERTVKQRIEGSVTRGEFAPESGLAGIFVGGVPDYRK